VNKKKSPLLEPIIIIIIRVIIRKRRKRETDYYAFIGVWVDFVARLKGGSTKIG